MPNYNPFRYSNPMPPEQFKGRKSELRRIIGRIVNAGESTSVTGPFRCGKTSLLQYVIEPDLKSALYGEKAHQFIFSYLDVSTLGSEFDQAQFWNHALETFQNYINTGNVVPSLSEAYQIAQQNQFGNYVLEKLIAEIKKANLRLVLTFDGFDALLHHKVLNSTEFFGGLRQRASLSKGALALLITGNTPLTQLNQETQDFNRTGSPYFNFMDEVILGPLSDSEIDKLLHLGNEYFTEDDRHFIKDIAGGHPYLLQTAASILWDAYEDGDKSDNLNQRRQHVAEEFLKKVINNLNTTWESWSSDMLRVFSSVALMQMDTLTNPPPTPMRLKLDRNQLIRHIVHLKSERDDLDRHGFLTEDETIRGGWRIKTGVFLPFIAAKLYREISGELNHSSYEKWLTAQKEQTSSNQQYYWGLAFIEAIATGMTKAFTSLSP
jgi:ABC-type iron transport system FetAB ATPase subunit